MGRLGSVVSRYPLVSRLYVYTVIAAAAAMTVALGVQRWSDLSQNALAIVILGLAAAITEFFPIRLPRSNSITVITVVYVFAFVTLPPAAAAYVAVLSSLIYGFLGRTSRLKSLFNAAQYAFTVTVAATIYHYLAGDSAAVLSSIRDYAALVVAGLAYFAINTGLVSMVVALTQRLSVAYVWRCNYANLALYYLGMLPAGCLLAVLWQDRPLMTPFAVALAVLIHRLFTVAITLEEQTNQALVALADIIGERDSYTSNHCRSVATWAERIARQLKLSDDAIEELTRAARLHDIGKIGIPNEMLRKPDRLSQEEWASMRKHPEIGEQILRFFPRFRAGLALVRHHHERYDGRGYPDGLRGEQIPFAARILCVADSLSAMMDERPYKTAMPIGDVIAELKRCNAEQFDPIVVGATITILKEDQRKEERVESIEPAHLRMVVAS